MNLTQRLLVALCLLGLLVSARPVESRAIGVATYSSTLPCDSVRSIETDFDENGVTDRVAAIDAGDHDAIRLVLNQSEPIVLSSTSPCELSALDFDRDDDVDLLSVDRQGDLVVWQNEHGHLRRLEPRGDAPTPHARQRLSVGLPSNRAAVQSGKLAGLSNRRLHSRIVFAAHDHVARSSSTSSPALKDVWLARPPPPFPISL